MAAEAAEGRGPVLAGAMGRYREHRPVAALDAHFRRIWSNSLARDHVASVAIVPDGCVDIIWVEGELLVAGPDVTASISPISAGTTVIGARFRAGAASAWLGAPMSEIVGSRVALREFWGGRAQEIAARIGEVATTEERMQVFETALSKVALDVELPASDVGFVFNALKSESAGRGMAVILDRLEVSPRTLRRRCHEAFGYGPKTLDRILRFQRFLALARQADAPPLAGLAFEAGYADQAHLTREVRRLSGFSPAAVLRQIGS